MSHCTTFAFSYADEATVVAAFRRMGLAPKIAAAGQFSAFSKKFLARLGYAGSRQWRAVFAQSGDYQIILLREEGGYRLVVEKHNLGDSDAPKIRELEQKFRSAYVRSSLCSVVQGLVDGGVRYEVEEVHGQIQLRFGAELERSLVIRFSDDGAIEEDVSGVMGGACEVLTAEVERLLSVETAVLNTTWKPERQVNMEDEVLQVLRLR